MDQSVVISLGFLVFAIIMFAWEKIPLSITAMIVAVGLHLTGVLSAKAAFAGPSLPVGVGPPGKARTAA